jgi:hypothetical protein
MNRQELIRFLQEESDYALQTLFPFVLGEIEKSFLPGGSTSVDFSSYLNPYQENIRVFIGNELVRKLEELGYKAYTTKDDDRTLVVIS